MLSSLLCALLTGLPSVPQEPRSAAFVPGRLPVQEGRLERVTVYRGQALAERVVTVQQAATGPLALRVGPLPMQAHPDSLQAQVRQGDAVVQGIEAFLMSGEAQATALEAELAAARRVLQERLGLERAEVKSLEAGLDGLAAMTAALGSDPSLGGLLDGDLASRLRALRQEVLTLEQDLVAARRAVADTEQEIADLDRRDPGSESRDYREVEISVFVQQAGPVEVKLSYLVDRAWWQPAYDLRVAPDLTGLQVNFLAEVRQSTGEDWSETELVLSTSRPNLGLDPPEVPRRRVEGGRWALESLGYVGEDASTDFRAAPSAGAVAREMAPETVVRDFGITTQFVLPGRSSLPSTGQMQRFRIRDLPLEVRPERYVVPSLSDKAYLRAEITNTGEVPLMAGRAKVFLGPDYLGVASMPLLRQGDATTVNLGIDPNLSVDYEVMEDSRDNPGRFSLSSTATITRRYRATMKLSAAARGRISVLVEEALPMSWDDRFKVEVLKAEPPADDREADLDLREERGLYRWRLYLSPGASQTIDWGYELSFDEDLLPVIQDF
jgi:uncharacterized protein (TIGR02231 family)